MNDFLGQENTFYLIIYFSIGIVYVIFLGIRAFSVFIVGLKASKVCCFLPFWSLETS